MNLKNPAKDTESDLAADLAGVTNPLPVTGGVDPEDAAVIKRLAPEEFRAETFGAVRPEDYAENAERLPFVQRAGARFRWSGSWLSAFVTADPFGSFQLSPEQRAQSWPATSTACDRLGGRRSFAIRASSTSILRSESASSRSLMQGR